MVKEIFGDPRNFGGSDPVNMLDVLLGSKIVLGYEEALWPKELEISHVSQILTHEPQIWVLS